MTNVPAGDLVAPTLAKAGVRTVFGLNGAHVQAILEGCLDHGIRLIDVRHESAAGHAAEGYAKATRGLGVAVVTAGPGFTNVLTSHGWGAIDPAQHPEGSNRPAGIRLGQARYDEVAKAFGGRGCHVTTLAELTAAIEEAFDAGLPTCINVEVGMGGLPPAFKAATLGIALALPAITN